MKTLQSFDRPSLRDLSADIQKTLKDLGETYGVSFTMGSIRFSTSQATFKLTASIMSAAGVVVDVDRDNYTKHADSFGLDSSWLDKTFTEFGKTFKIVGLQPRRTKNPVLVERDGKKYIMPVEAVLRGMKNVVPPSTPKAPSNEVGKMITDILKDINNHRANFSLDKPDKGEDFWEGYDKSEKDIHAKIDALDAQLKAHDNIFL